MSDSLDPSQIRRLLDIGRSLVATLSLDALLDEILDAARDLTGARYAALGVLNEARDELERFITVGIDEADRPSIGELPRGRGVLGILMADARPLRIAHVGEHPQSYGFPLGHPPMGSFLGVPVLIRGEAWGNLYLTEKQDGDFTAADEEALVILAEWAGTAIDNARLYGKSERARAELERAVRGLEATRDIAIAIGMDTNVRRVLELIVKRGRALVNANTVLIMLKENEELYVAASAGHAITAKGLRVPIGGSTSGRVLTLGRPARIPASEMLVAPEALGVPDAETVLVVPMISRGERLGVLAAFDSGPGQHPFSEDDEQMLRGFAASAANAVTMAQSVETGRLRSALSAADGERQRWARELHDETLQGLGGLRLLLASVVRQVDPDAEEADLRRLVREISEGLTEAMGEIELAIENLRAIISDLRPAALDDLGLRAALVSLIERRTSTGVEIASQLELPDPHAGDERLDSELETTIYRLVQEALTNIAKHAHANSASVHVWANTAEITVEIHDDGVGFEVNSSNPGFGLVGMRERTYLAGGRLEISSGASGTTLRAQFPAHGSAGAIQHLAV